MEMNVAIGLPVYNGEAHLENAVKSLLAQDYQDFEIIISDNGSRDKTPEICRRLAESDYRIRYVREEKNRGSAWNFNRVFDLADGKYFMWSAHDDWRGRNYISRCLAAFGYSNGIVSVGTYTEGFNAVSGERLILDRGINTVGQSPERRFAMYLSYLQNGSCLNGIFYGLHKRDILKKVLPLKQILTCDHLFLAHLSLLGEFFIINEVQLHKRWGGASANFKANAKAQCLKQNPHVYFPYLIRELWLQKIIFRMSVKIWKKIKLSLISLYYYILFLMRRIYWVLRDKQRCFMKMMSCGRFRKWNKGILRSGVHSLRIAYFYLHGKRPWSFGYREYKERSISRVLRDPLLLENFRAGMSLPDGFGLRVDERIVEYPWLFSRLDRGPARLLDAGAVLNYSYLLENEILLKKRIVVFNLTKERRIDRKDLSYVRGDLRKTGFEDEAFDEIVCLSTLEHIGMDNVRVYTNDERFCEARPQDYLIAVKELRRLVRKGGRVFLTVPYGRYENLSWLQQFDEVMIRRIIEVFGSGHVAVNYYTYTPGGWKAGQVTQCSDNRYFDVHASKKFDADFAAAARAVACIEITL